MQALVILRRVLQTLYHLPRRHAQIRHRLLVVVGLLHRLLAVRIAGGGGGAGGLGELLGRAAREVEVHGRGFEEVVGDFVLVVDGADDVRADVAFVVEGLHAAPDAGPLSDFQFALPGDGVAELVVFRGVGVDPLFDLDGAGAVVEFVGHVCGLGGDVADLADEGDLGDFGAFDGEFGVGVGLRGGEDLQDGEGAEGVFAVGALEED